MLAYYDGVIKIEVRCPFCGHVSSIFVDTDGAFAYTEGAKVQEAFPYLHVSEREILISGLCRKCQSIFFED